MTGRQVNIAIVGTGFIADTRARAYSGVTGYDPRLVAAVSRTRENAEAYGRKQHLIEKLETSAGVEVRRRQKKTGRRDIDNDAGFRRQCRRRTPTAE